MNMQIDVFDQTGSKISKHKLTSEIFEADINLALVHQALYVQESNKRQGTAKVKTKGEVRGGGRKPWRQKGTGRARAGSTRSPIWRGGGVTFGPTGDQNYSKDMPKKQKRKALFSTLSQKAKQDSMIGLTAIDEKNLKTSLMSKLLDKLPVKRNALLIAPNADDKFKRAFSNIPFVKVVHASYLDIHSLLKYETIIFMTDSFAVVDKTWKEEAIKLLSSRKSVEKRGAKVVKKTAPVKKVLVEEKVKEVAEPVKKVVAKKTVAKKAATKKVVTKKVVVKKTVVKKVPAKKAVAKKVTKKVTKKVKE